MNKDLNKLIDFLKEKGIKEMKTVKESLRTASRKYAGVKEDADLEEEAYFNPHKVAQFHLRDHLLLRNLNSLLSLHPLQRVKD